MKYRRTDKSSLQYKLITGIFIISVLLGLFFCAVYYEQRNYMFWLYVLWTLFFVLVTYCWIDDKRYEKFENIMTPVFFGLLGMMFVLAAIGCLFFNVFRYFRGEASVWNLIGGLIGAASCAMMAYFDYQFYLKDYLKRRY